MPIHPHVVAGHVALEGRPGIVEIYDKDFSTGLKLLLSPLNKVFPARIDHCEAVAENDQVEFFGQGDFAESTVYQSQPIGEFSRFAPGDLQHIFGQIDTGDGSTRVFLDQVNQVFPRTTADFQDGFDSFLLRVDRRHGYFEAEKKTPTGSIINFGLKLIVTADFTGDGRREGIDDGHNDQLYNLK